MGTRLLVANLVCAREGQRRQSERDCRNSVTARRIAVIYETRRLKQCGLCGLRGWGRGEWSDVERARRCLVTHILGWTLTLFPSAPAARRAKLRGSFHDTLIAYVL
jgi:hypothetical protein